MWKFVLLNAAKEELYSHQEPTLDQLESWVVGFGNNCPEGVDHYQVIDPSGNITTIGEWPRKKRTVMQITNVESHRSRSADMVNKKIRVHIILEGENLLQNWGGRTSRPWKAWKPLVEAKLREMEIPFEKVRWSQYAGCSCPCSPGFIVEGPRRGEMIWMTIDGSPTTVDPELSSQRIAALTSQL